MAEGRAGPGPPPRRLTGVDEDEVERRVRAAEVDGPHETVAARELDVRRLRAEERLERPDRTASPRAGRERDRVVPGRVGRHREAAPRVHAEAVHAAVGAAADRLGDARAGGTHGPGVTLRARRAGRAHGPGRTGRTWIAL